MADAHFDSNAIVARYLRDKGYDKALAGLLSDLDIDSIDTKDAEPLTRILDIHFSAGPKSGSADDDTLGGIPPAKRFTGLANASEPSSTFDSGSLVIGGTVCPGTDNGLPRLVVSFADKKIRQYGPLELDVVHTVSDLHAGAPVKVICAIDATTVLTGALDGRLIVSNLETGNVSGIFSAHKRFVAAMDVWQDYVVSAGHDQLVCVFRLVNGSLKLIASEKLPTVPTAVKLVKIDKLDNRLCVMVTRNDSTLVEYFSVESLAKLKHTNLCDAVYASDSFSPRDIALDESRTQYAVVTDHIPYMRIITGVVGSEAISNNIVVLTLQSQYSMPKIIWSHSGTGVWVTGDDGIVRGVQVADGRIVSELKGHKDVVRFVQACQIDGQEVVMSGGTDGKVLTWR